MKKPLSRGELLQLERYAERLRAGQPKPMQRRIFLKLGGVGGLALGWACASDKPAAMGDMVPTEPGPVPGEDPMLTEGEPEPPIVEPEAPAVPVTYYEVNAYVRIGSDESVAMYVAQSDMGQGVLTALPMIIAEELDVDWTKVRSEHPIADQAKYGNWFTVASASVSSSFTALRRRPMPPA